MAKVAPFHTSNEEDHKRSPVWHDESTCSEGKKILAHNKVSGKKGNKCLVCKQISG